MGRVERGVLRLLLPVAGQLERALQDREAVGAIADRLAGGGRLAVSEQIDTPQLDGIDAERPGDHVHMPLARELRLGRPEPAERAERHRVREHGAAGDAHVIAGVRPRGVDDRARQDDR